MGPPLLVSLGDTRVVGIGLLYLGVGLVLLVVGARHLYAEYTAIRGEGTPPAPFDDEPNATDVPRRLIAGLGGLVFLLSGLLFVYIGVSTIYTCSIVGGTASYC